VPSLVIGPSVRRGCVNDLQFEHCSIGATLMKRFGIAPLNERMAQAADLSSCIHPDYIDDPQPGPPVPLIDVSISEILAGVGHTTSQEELFLAAGVTLDEALPAQGPGRHHALLQAGAKAGRRPSAPVKRAARLVLRARCVASAPVAYVVLARKYRPQRFADLVGQEHVTRTLANAIAHNRVHHAYLFCGARGLGKTTAARLLAKCLVCVKGPTIDPCNVCNECVAVTEGRSVDVIEIDGASNNRVEDVRNLRDQVRYLPQTARRKIYIIDEVHMLTGSAFNALLKTLEEPPEHVTFIFATTEVHELPATILSRVSRFDFRRLSSAQLVAHLQWILPARASGRGGRPLHRRARRRRLGARLADPARQGHRLRQRHQEGQRRRGPRRARGPEHPRGRRPRRGRARPRRPPSPCAASTRSSRPGRISWRSRSSSSSTCAT
jgi:hypothetical protein